MPVSAYCKLYLLILTNKYEFCKAQFKTYVKDHTGLLSENIKS